MPELFMGENSDNSGNNAIFAENNMQDSFYYGNKRDKTRLGEQRTMEDSTIRGILGNAKAVDGLSAVIAKTHYGTNARTNTQRARSEHYAAQTERIAKENGVWYNDAVSELTTGTQLGKGGESTVYRSKSDATKVVKIMGMSLMTDSQDLVYKTASHNHLFQNTRYSIIGFTRNEQGNVSVVLEQPYINKVGGLTQQQIDDFMLMYGFAPHPTIRGRYENSEFIVTDALVRTAEELEQGIDDNVLIDEQGNLYFIDPFVIPAKLIESANDNQVVRVAAIDTQLNWANNEDVVSNMPDGEGFLFGSLISIVPSLLRAMFWGPNFCANSL